MKWLKWQLYRLWIGCQEKNCTHYSRWAEGMTVARWHESVHHSFLERREYPHYGMVTPAGDRYARRNRIYQYAQIENPAFQH